MIASKKKKNKENVNYIYILPLKISKQSAAGSSHKDKEAAKIQLATTSN